MAKNDYETSEESGQPVSLFLFRFGPGAGDVIRNTDGTSAVTYDSEVYTPAAIEQLSDVESKQKQDENAIELKVPLDQGVPELFLIYPPTQVVTVTIREGHIPNPDDPGSWATGENFPVSWTGRVLEVSREDSYAKLTCEAASASMERPGLRRHYQRQCTHTVYRGRCGAVKAANETPAVVSAVGVNTVTLTEPWVLSGREEADYIRGTVEWIVSGATVVRSILRIVGGNQLVLSGPVSDLAALDDVNLYPGCPKTTVACANIHDAILTFGGFPGIPKENPVGKNNHT